jgi:hypothetical protein
MLYAPLCLILEGVIRCKYMTSRKKREAHAHRKLRGLLPGSYIAAEPEDLEHLWAISICGAS